jgi:hypothetical protein
MVKFQLPPKRIAKSEATSYVAVTMFRRPKLQWQGQPQRPLKFESNSIFSNLTKNRVVFASILPKNVAS